jgi:hypothetical protein
MKRTGGFAGRPGIETQKRRARPLSRKQQIEPEEISQDEPTYRLDGTAGSTTMIISFAVFPAPGGKSAFDFVRATNPLRVQKLFLRDPNMMW